MKCAVITPVGPGHKEIYNRCAKSIDDAVQTGMGPFSAVEAIPVWDLQGKFGRSARRNTGMLQARKSGCDWLFFLDADDYMSPEAFIAVSEYINDYDAIWGNICEAPSNDLSNVKLREGQLQTATTIDDILNTDPYLTLQMGHFVRTSCALAVKFDETMNAGEDFKYYLRLWAQYKCIKAPVIFFVNCRGNHSTGPRSADGRAWGMAVLQEMDRFKAGGY
ncbi:MAG: glycosyltransferase [Betaproteobacteria bacterium]